MLAQGEFSSAKTNKVWSSRGHIVCRISLNGFLDVFLLFDCVICFGQKITAYQEYMQSTWLFIVDVCLDQLDDVLFVIFLHCKITPSPIHSVFFGRLSPCTAHTWGVGCFAFAHLGEIIYVTILLHKRSVCSPLCIYLLNHAFISVEWVGYFF